MMAQMPMISAFKALPMTNRMTWKMLIWPVLLLVLMNQALATELLSVEIKRHPDAKVRSIIFLLTGDPPVYLPELSAKDRAFGLQFFNFKNALLQQHFDVGNLVILSLNPQPQGLGDMHIQLATESEIHGAMQMRLSGKNYQLVLNIRNSNTSMQKTTATGTFDNPIIDSDMSRDEAMKNVARLHVPAHILRRQKLVSVKYYSFDRKIHQGQLVIDERLVSDIEDIFALALQEKFPVHSVIPISRFDWDDDKSMAANNTSGFNYRKVEGKNTLSKHAFGQALDINPVQNPYIRSRRISPPDASYNRTLPGTLTADSAIVKAFLKKGWIWGGNWWNMKDYQHFQKPLKW